MLKRRHKNLRISWERRKSNKKNFRRKWVMNNNSRYNNKMILLRDKWRVIMANNSNRDQLYI